uniref:Cytochrome P450 monooxygenase n=1 Tax=Plectus sambesii TaxID=2011161 RepID=A0A914UPM4_9BILA
MLWTVILVLGPILYLLYRHYVNVIKHWKLLGVPGPEPTLVWGNLKSLLNVDYPPPFQLRDWTRKYGKTYGIYEGSRRVLVTSDPDLLQDVFLKKFDHFHGRKMGSLAGNVDKEPNVNVFAARGLRWKRIRTIANPTFSVSNLKKMLPTVQDSVTILVNLLDKHAEDEKAFNIHLYFQELTIDVIARVALGHDESLQGNNPYIELCKALFNRPLRNPFEVGSSLFPEVQPWIRKAATATAKLRGMPFPILFEKLTAVVNERRNNREKYKGRSDFIELFLDAEAEEDWVKEGHHLDHAGDYDKSALKVSKKLTSNEIVAQCFVFLLAGFDTTANSLAYVSYLLATNPDVQAKLYAEIDDICTDEQITYEQITQMKYLDAVMKEGLRLYPLGAFANSRICMKPCTLGNIPIEEGTFVQADVWTIHYDKELWGADADQFRPERWEGEEKRHQMAWLS